jgi:hypothetical protein
MHTSYIVLQNLSAANPCQLHTFHSSPLLALHVIISCALLMPLKQNNWEIDDDLAFRNEFKLIDDSYYRVYDDLDYEVWRERVLSLVVIRK